MQEASIRARFEWLGAVARARTSATALRVAACIAAHLNADKGEAWPSLVTIAAWCGCHKRHAARAIAELVCRELLTIADHGGPHRSRRY